MTSALTNKFLDILKDTESALSLANYASKCQSILYCGFGNSQAPWAYMYGLYINQLPMKKIILNDIDACPMNEIINLTKGTGLQVSFELKNNLFLDCKENVDMIVLDTLHVYGQTKKELAKFADHVSKLIVIHNTRIDKDDGEIVRKGLPVPSYLTKDEALKGTGLAIEEFLKDKKEWSVVLSTEFGDGITVLRRA